MCKKCICIIFLCALVSNILAAGLQIIFNENSTNVVGTAPFMRNFDNMYEYAMEQAAIFATKLDESFCIFRSATLQRDYDDEEHGETVIFSVNVVSDIDLLWAYVDAIECIQSIEYSGYAVGIWDVYSDVPSVQVSQFDDVIYLDATNVSLDGNVFIATATAKHSKLDLALDDAFQYALTEISRYQDTNIKNMNRSINEFAEHALLLNAENVVSNVKFSKVRLLYTDEQGVGFFIAEVSLKKEF